MFDIMYISVYSCTCICIYINSSWK